MLDATPAGALLSAALRTAKATRVSRTAHRVRRRTADERTERPARRR